MMDLERGAMENQFEALIRSAQELIGTA